MRPSNAATELDVLSICVKRHSDSFRRDIRIA
jgi:hypothetical protein